MTRCYNSSIPSDLSQDPGNNAAKLNCCRVSVENGADKVLLGHG